MLTFVHLCSEWNGNRICLIDLWLVFLHGKILTWIATTDTAKFDSRLIIRPWFEYIWMSWSYWFGAIQTLLLEILRIYWHACDRSNNARINKAHQIKLLKSHIGTLKKPEIHIDQQDLIHSLMCEKQKQSWWTMWMTRGNSFSARCHWHALPDPQNNWCRRCVFQSVVSKVDPPKLTPPFVPCF